MSNSNLKKAVAAGSIALVWSICSLNLPGIIAAIISWIIYGKPKKNGAKAAGVFYVISFIGSIIFVLLLMIALVGNRMAGLINGMAIFSLFGDALYIAAAVFSFKAAGEINDSSNDNGFFD
ncbi:MAG: hypothetical protein ACI4J0_05300 [Huintestinicola sp.]|uniref:hypothetical protein n=1 Tax=Huintestinicola sp. TaxID=2981661 RepID=UPI003F106A52